MTSIRLLAFYDSGPALPPRVDAKAAAKSAPIRSATPGPNGSSSIHRLEARGNVVVTKNDQVVTGQTAVFDTRTNLISVLGGVVLTQCQYVVRGDRLLVDMTTGVSRVESDSGKVQALLPRSGAGCGSSTGSGASNKPK
jgi:lipopolysaccharide export system protein LptA